jgi:hypothetical protein
LPKPKTASRRQQMKAIRGYVKQGLSANKIQKKLQKQSLGIRRKVLLAEIRKIKGTKPKADRKKYTPWKYRRRKPPARKPVFFGKQVAVYGYAWTRRSEELAKELKIPSAYSARFEFSGRGRDLADAVRLAYSGIVPKYEEPFVECGASAFLNNPSSYGERGKWIESPEIKS